MPPEGIIFVGKLYQGEYGPENCELFMYTNFDLEKDWGFIGRVLPIEGDTGSMKDDHRELKNAQYP